MLSEPALVSIAQGLAASTFAVDAPVPPAGDRAFERLLSTPAYEAWVISWSPGARLELHDHGGSLAAVHVVAGTLTEQVVDKRDRSVITRGLPADTTVTVPSRHAHAVRNLGDVDAVSVHVYSPPLEAMAFFDSTEGGAFQATRTEHYAVAAVAADAEGR